MAMKRQLTALLTFAMVGSLLFMGAAGTAAAQDSLVDVGSDVSTNQTAQSAAIVDTDQQNNNSQVQAAGAAASSDKSTAKTVATQEQDVTQVNQNSVSDVNSVASNNATTDARTGIELNVTADIGLELGNDSLLGDGA